jgi:hypothetical protein
MTLEIYGWWSRRRLGAARALNKLTEARHRANTATKLPAPPKPDLPSRWNKILTVVVAFVVLAGTAVIALVVVGTQVDFYRATLKLPAVDFRPLLPIKSLDLALFTPIAVEGLSWMCLLMSVVLSLANRSAVTCTRAMWAFASIAALVNATHAIRNRDDLLGGVVTGGLSLAGPFVLHLFVGWVHQMRSGKTLRETRVDTAIRWATIGRRARALTEHILDHLVHPKTALLTIWVWRAFRGMSYNHAWTVASQRLRKSVLAQCRKPVDEPCAVTPEPPVATPVPETVATPVEERAHGAVLAPERDDDALDESAFHAELANESQVDTILRNWTDEQRAHGSTSGNAGTVTGHAPPGSHNSHTTPKPVRTPRKPHGRTGKTKRAARTNDTVEKPLDQDAVTAEFWRRKHAGEPVEGDGVNISALSRELGVGRSHVSKTWKECINGTRPDPNPNRK